MADITMSTNPETIGSMTRAELILTINRIVDERLRVRPWPGQRIDRPVSEVLESMRRHIIKPAAGQPSTLEMLREDRYQ